MNKKEAESCREGVPAVGDDRSPDHPQRVDHPRRRLCDDACIRTPLLICPEDD